MTTQSTIDKLIEMRLTSMSDAFLSQLQDARMKDISFEDRLMPDSTSQMHTSGISTIPQGGNSIAA